MPHRKMWTEKPHSQRGLYRRPEKNERECWGREGRPPGKTRREKRWSRGGKAGGSGFCGPAVKRRGVIWLTFSPCYAESPAEHQQSQGEQPLGQCHLVIQLWRTGSPLEWVHVWARCGLLTVLESCVPPLLEAGLDPCHQLLGILLSPGSCLLQACGRKRQPVGLGPRGRADPGVALLPGCSPTAASAWTLGPSLLLNSVPGM